MKRRRIAALLIASVAMLAVSCGSDEPAVADAAGEIRIELDEFSFSPSKIRLTPGETVTLVLVNVGEKEHEFMSGNDGMMMEDGDHEEMGHTGFGVNVPVGETVRVTFPVPADASGEFNFGCFTDDGAQWDDGMKGNFSFGTS